MTELKPCPFCGGEATIRYEKSFDVHYVHCDTCGSETGNTGLYSEEDKAIDAWNRRVKPGDDKSLTDEEMEILNDMPALKRLAMIAGFEVER